MPHKSQPTTCLPCSYGAGLLLPHLTWPWQCGHFQLQAESSAILLNQGSPWDAVHLPSRLSPLLQRQRDKGASSSHFFAVGCWFSPCLVVSFPLHRQSGPSQLLPGRSGKQRLLQSTGMRWILGECPGNIQELAMYLTRDVLCVML